MKTETFERADARLKVTKISHQMDERLNVFLNV